MAELLGKGLFPLRVISGCVFKGFPLDIAFEILLLAEKIPALLWAWRWRTSAPPPVFHLEAPNMLRNFLLGHSFYKG